MSLKCLLLKRNLGIRILTPLATSIKPKLKSANSKLGQKFRQSAFSSLQWWNWGSSSAWQDVKKKKDDLKRCWNLIPWKVFQNRETTPVQSELDSILPGDMGFPRLLLQASMKSYCQGVITSNLGLFKENWPQWAVILTESHGSNKGGWDD